MNDVRDEGGSDEEKGERKHQREVVQTMLQCPENGRKAPSEIRPHGVNNIQYLLRPHKQPPGLQTR